MGRASRRKEPREIFGGSCTTGSTRSCTARSERTSPPRGARGIPPAVRTGRRLSEGGYRVQRRTPGGCPLRVSGRAAAPCGCRARTALSDRGVGVLRAASRPATRFGPPARAQRRDEPMRPLVVDHCCPSFAVAFEHHFAHRAQGKACVSLQPVQMPFEARDRRQVHRGPRVPAGVFWRTTDSSPKRQRPRRRRRMASTRPPKTYSPSARTGRRSERSGGVGGMVRHAGCDAGPRSLRSSAPVDGAARSISRF